MRRVWKTTHQLLPDGAVDGAGGATINRHEVGEMIRFWTMRHKIRRNCGHSWKIIKQSYKAKKTREDYRKNSIIIESIIVIYMKVKLKVK